jgi:hypothetical protein
VAVAVGAKVFSVEAATVHFDPPIATVERGNSVSMSIVGGGFTVLPSGFLDGGGVNLTFDPLVVRVSSVTIDPFWDPAFSVPGWSIDNIHGVVAPINFGTAGTGASGSFGIATVGFQVVGLGNCALTLAENADNPFGSGGSPVPVAFEAGQIVGVVPAVPPRLSYAVGSSKITLSWPTDHVGWSLQVQTNSPSTGLSTNWVTLPGSDLTNLVTFPLDKANGTVFYRLYYKKP